MEKLTKLAELQIWLYYANIIPDGLPIDHFQRPKSSNGKSKELIGSISGSPMKKLAR